MNIVKLFVFVFFIFLFANSQQIIVNQIINFVVFMLFGVAGAVASMSFVRSYRLKNFIADFFIGVFLSTILYNFIPHLTSYYSIVTIACFVATFGVHFVKHELCFFQSNNYILKKKILPKSGNYLLPIALIPP